MLCFANGPLLACVFIRDVLSRVFDEVVEVNLMDSEDYIHLAFLKRPELGLTLTKLHCWTLTHYRKCVFLDADTLVRAGSGADPTFPPLMLLNHNATLILNWMAALAGQFPRGHEPFCLYHGYSLHPSHLQHWRSRRDPRGDKEGCEDWSFPKSG